MDKLKIFNKNSFSKTDIALMAVLVIAVVVLFVMSMISYEDASETNIKFAKQSVEELAKQSAKELEAKFEERFAILEYVATLPSVYNMDWEEQYEFLKGKEHDLGFEHVFIMDMNGKGYYVENNMIRDQSGEQFFADIKDVDRFITEPFSTDGKSITTLCVPIYKDGTKVGIMCGAFNLADVFKIVKGMQNNDGMVTVVNYKGEYVADANMGFVYNMLNILDSYDENDIKLIADNLTNPNTVTGDVEMGNKEYYASIVKMKGVNWKVILTIDKNQTMGNMDGLRNTQIASVVILLVVIIVTVRFMYNLHLKEKRAFIDDITGISNRARCSIIMDKLDTYTNDDVTIISFDLNDFKDINDAYGHKEGDEAIKVFAKVLNKTFGRVGFIGRMGGDEFIAVLINTKKEMIDKLVNDMKQHIKNINADRTQKYVLSTSYGCGFRSAEEAETKSIQDAYEEADKNMYEYKKVYKSIKNK